MISPLRSTTPVSNVNGNTRPTSPISSSPHRYTIVTTSASINYPNNSVRSREVSREREREPLDYTDLEGNYSKNVREYFTEMNFVTDTRYKNFEIIARRIGS